MQKINAFRAVLPGMAAAALLAICTAAAAGQAAGTEGDSTGSTAKSHKRGAAPLTQAEKHKLAHARNRSLYRSGYRKFGPIARPGPIYNYNTRRASPYGRITGRLKAARDGQPN